MWWDVWRHNVIWLEMYALKRALNTTISCLKDLHFKTPFGKVAGIQGSHLKGDKAQVQWLEILPKSTLLPLENKSVINVSDAQLQLQEAGSQIFPYTASLSPLKCGTGQWSDPGFTPQSWNQTPSQYFQLWMVDKYGLQIFFIN